MLTSYAARLRRKVVPAPHEGYPGLIARTCVVSVRRAMIPGVVDGLLFEDVADAIRGLVPGDLGKLHYSHHRYGIKVWFGGDKAPREHYEAQLIRAGDRTETTSSLEVGFHSEHPKETDNEAVISRLLRSERAWRRGLGPEAQVGGFLGAAANWRRVSEVWPDPDLGDPELAFEVAARLTDYVTTLEPYLRRDGGRPPRFRQP